MKKFIFNADDLGLSPLTTNGILQCSTLVKSASLMVTSSCVDEAYKKATDKGISIGIHLNVSGEGDFINQSKSFGKSGIINKAYKNKEPLPSEIVDEMFAEFDKQLELFKHKFRSDPAHVNFHHPLYQIPNFVQSFREYIEKVSLPTRWFKDLEPISVPHPNHTEFRFYDKLQINIDHLIQIMHEAPEGVTEFVLHPGLTDKSLNSSYIVERQMQVVVLRDVKLIKTIKENGWKLTNFDEIR